MLHLAALILFTSQASGASDAASAAKKALDYLAIEVPKWKTQNGCYSCHNNGDAARALMAGNRLEAVSDTVRWLAESGSWDAQQSDAPFRDKRLARVSFSLALAEAVERGLIPKQATGAARALASLQGEDGSWFIDQGGAVGSPATYGTPLATYAAMRLMKQGGLQEGFQKAARWLSGVEPGNTVDHAAKILGLSLAGMKVDATPLLATQARDGGWGPYRNVPPEAFDTAIAVLALRAAGNQEAVRKGVQWLIREQLKEGGWAGTTRPGGGSSYAQHISTTGWAVLALIEK